MKEERTTLLGQHSFPAEREKVREKFQCENLAYPSPVYERVSLTASSHSLGVVIFSTLFPFSRSSVGSCCSGCHSFIS